MARSARRRAAVAALASLLSLSACSVSTPRDGFTQRGSGDQQLVAGSEEPTGGDAASGAEDDGGDTAATGSDAPSTATGAESLGTGGGGATSGGATASGGGAASGGGTAGGGASGSASGATATTTQTTVAGRSAAAVGVTKDTITISAIAGFSGNYGAILNKIYDNGFGTWIDDVNAKGGIHGRKVVAKKVDNKDTAEGGVAACKEIQNNGSYLAVSIVGFGGADVSAVDCLDKAGITTLALNMSAFSSRWKNVFSAGDASKQTRTLATFIKNVIGDRNGKIGIIYTNDPVNSSGRRGLVEELGEQKMNLVHQEPVAPNQGSFVAELSRMQGAGATSVALVVNTNEVLGILRDARAINYTPNWTGNYWVTDENTAAARAIFDGIKAIRNYSATNSAAFEAYAAKARQYGRGDITNSTTMALYGIGLLAGQVLQNAGSAPTKEGLPGAIERIVNYNNGITMSLSFGPGVRVAEVGMWPIQCCNPDNTWRGIGAPKTDF